VSDVNPNQPYENRVREAKGQDKKKWVQVDLRSEERIERRNSNVRMTTNSGLGKRSCNPTPAYSNSHRATAAKVCAKYRVLLEHAEISWNEVELSTK
jgi:hypothetical protein